MERFTTGVLSLILAIAIVSCKTNQENADCCKVKLRRDDNAKELVVYDTIVELDYLTEESKKNKGVSNFEFFEGFDYPMLKSEFEADDQLTFFNESVRISIKIKSVDSLQFKSNLALDSNFYKTAYGLLEHQFLPSHQISSISISINGKLNEIPYSEYENMFDPNIITTEDHVPAKAYLTETGEILLQMDNSAGADFYYLIFLFDKEGGLKKRIVKNVL